MKNKEIVSAIVGASFFAFPYLGLSVALIPSLVMGASAFGASELVFSGFKRKVPLKESNRTLYEKITTAKKQNKEILSLVPKVEKELTRVNLNEIHDTVSKIIKVVENDSKKEKMLNNFFDYYLPVLTKIVNRYDEIENQKLISNDGKSFMTKADKMISDTNKSFKTILSNLYEDDIMDADADMKVYNLMLKADGIVEDNIVKGGVEDE